jgi:predicted GIY-YIG superfamily endonuclease
MLGTVYAIVDESDKILYVGSTNDFKHRKYKHKSDSKTSNIKLYVYLRERGWETFHFVTLEEAEFADKDARRLREEEYRLKHNPPLNERRCHMTIEQRKEYHREYNEKNREVCKAYNRKYYEKNRDRRQSQYRKMKKDKKQIHQVMEEILAQVCSL